MRLTTQLYDETYKLRVENKRLEILFCLRTVCCMKQWAICGVKNQKAAYFAHIYINGLSCKLSESL